MSLPEWDDPAWSAATRDWVDGVLAGAGRVRTGPLQPVRSWALSRVDRVPTSAGDLFVKATSAHFPQEPAVTAWLAGRFPGLVPDVVAVDVARRCLLMAPLPPEESTAATLPAAAAALARVQAGSVGAVAELVGLGAPRRSLGATADRFVAVAEDGVEVGRLTGGQRRALRAAVPRVLDRVAELDAAGLPDTLCHGDLHLGNVAPRGEAAVVYDWSDAHVGHPLLDVTHLVAQAGELPDPVPVGWLDRYLDAWRPGYDDGLLRRALDLAVLADRVFQAVTYEDIARSLGPGQGGAMAGVQAGILLRVTELAR